MGAGATFNKWDLHIHTPLSYENQYEFISTEERGKYDGDIFEKYITELEKIDDISCIGITDYFSIEGYKEILEAKSAGRLNNFQLVLPNIEFRLDTFVGGKRLNYHVIFSEDLNPDIIESQFLNELQIEKPGGEKIRLSHDNIETIGATLKDQQAEFRDRSDYYI